MQVEAWLQRAAYSAPTRTALHTAQERMSYAELLHAACSAAAELAERGAYRGARIAIALPPGIEFAQALHGCFLLGAVAVPVDPRLTASERARILAGATVVVEQPMSRASPAAHEQPLSRISAGAPVSNTFASELTHELTHELDAVCAVIHTSGTTSTPRPVELTYGNFLWSALGSAVALGVDPEERWLCALPLAHVGGLSILVRSAIYATTAHIHERFHTASVLAALQEERITLVSLVATTLSRLLDAGLQDPPHLRCALTGGGPVPAALVARARAAGVPVVETYGLTECCSQAATAPPASLSASWSGAGAPGRGKAAAPQRAKAELSREPGAGAPLFCTRIEIAEDGEILLSGPTVARCALAADGRLHTGDVGSIDRDGFLHVTGRKADTIVSGGENVAPSEVEAVLETFPGVLEAAVVGREDPQWGEAVTAIVVVAPQTSVGELVLREHCAARLASFKVPKRVELVTAPLPRTRSGKLLRREL